MSEPKAAGVAELIITPSGRSVVGDGSETPARQLGRHVLFARRSCRASFAVQYLCARTLHTLTMRPMDTLEQDEWLVDLLRMVLDVNAPRPASALRTRRLIRRTKEFLEGHAAAPFACPTLPARSTHRRRPHRSLPPA